VLAATTVVSAAPTPAAIERYFIDTQKAHASVRFRNPRLACSRL